jgi:hypothetical protein
MARRDQTLERGIKKQLHGEDQPLFDSRGQPASLLPHEQAKKINLQLMRVAEHLAAPQRIVPRIEELQKKGLITMSLVNAGRYYAVLAFMADGPSVGVGRYGDFQPGQPAWDRNGTTDERMRARALFNEARKAAFSIRDKNNAWVYDEQLRHAVEPIILGDAAGWTPAEVGRWLSGYTSRNGANAAGVTEVVAVLRRLRLFFALGEE